MLKQVGPRLFNLNILTCNFISCLLIVMLISSCSSLPPGGSDDEYFDEFIETGEASIFVFLIDKYKWSSKNNPKFKPISIFINGVKHGTVVAENYLQIKLNPGKYYLETDQAYVSGSFFEVLPNQHTILAQIQILNSYGANFQTVGYTSMFDDTRYYLNYLDPDTKRVNSKYSTPTSTNELQALSSLKRKTETVMTAISKLRKAQEQHTDRLLDFSVNTEALGVIISGVTQGLHEYQKQQSNSINYNASNANSGSADKGSNNTNLNSTYKREVTKIFAFNYLECWDTSKKNPFVYYYSQAFSPIDYVTWSDGTKASKYENQIEKQGAQQLGVYVKCDLNRGGGPAFRNDNEVLNYYNAELSKKKNFYPPEQRQVNFFTLRSNYINYNFEFVDPYVK